MERDQGREDSVYDFLYVDESRIARFLSQFEQFGHLTSLTRTVSESSTRAGGLNVHVAKLDSSASAQTTQTRQFDPRWLAPLSFLDQAGRKGMIVRGLDNARIGQLVLITGDLTVFNLALFKELWPLPSVRSAILRAAQASNEPAAGTPNRNERRRQERQKASSGEPPSPIEVGLELLNVLPHGMLAVVRHGSLDVWSSLREADMVVAPSDLLLNHGVRIAGSWAMLGILDALPDDPASETENVLSQITSAISLGSLGAVIGQLAPQIRAMLGRPAAAYGMTPLLIFREVSA